MTRVLIEEVTTLEKQLCNWLDDLKYNSVQEKCRLLIEDVSLATQNNLKALLFQDVSQQGPTSETNYEDGAQKLATCVQKLKAYVKIKNQRLELTQENVWQSDQEQSFQNVRERIEQALEYLQQCNKGSFKQQTESKKNKSNEKPGYTQESKENQPTIKKKIKFSDISDDVSPQMNQNLEQNEKNSSLEDALLQQKKSLEKQFVKIQNQQKRKYEMRTQAIVEERLALLKAQLEREFQQQLIFQKKQLLEDLEGKQQKSFQSSTHKGSFYLVGGEESTQGTFSKSLLNRPHSRGQVSTISERRAPSLTQNNCSTLSTHMQEILHIYQHCTAPTTAAIKKRPPLPIQTNSALQSAQQKQRVPAHLSSPSQEQQQQQQHQRSLENDADEDAQHIFVRGNFQELKNFYMTGKMQFIQGLQKTPAQNFASYVPPLQPYSDSTKNNKRVSPRQEECAPTMNSSKQSSAKKIKCRPNQSFSSTTARSQKGIPARIALEGTQHTQEAAVYTVSKKLSAPFQKITDF